ncbi:MAG: hypothetical protein HQL87_02570 [Magnetococcales bacterium]|nr:hypothetical protein [Magnetococcales bacterium]
MLDPLQCPLFPDTQTSKIPLLSVANPPLSNVKQKTWMIVLAIGENNAPGSPLKLLKKDKKKHKAGIVRENMFDKERNITHTEGLACFGELENGLS